MHALVALIGVQSNQYPRALDIARPFRQVGIPVVMGGFHISGCLSMLDGHAVERRPDLPRERLWVFWPRFVWHTLRTHAISVYMVMRLLLWKRAITRDPDARTYADLALTPVCDDDVRLDLLTKTARARAAVAHVNKVNELIGATRPHSTAE